MPMYSEDYDPDYEESAYARSERAENAKLNRDKRLYICPDCGQKRLTAYQKAHHYHCDVCTRNIEQTGGIYGF